MAHSDDFRWFGDLKDIAEWDLLLKSFNNHKYKVTDCTDKEFVGNKNLLAMKTLIISLIKQEW